MRTVVVLAYPQVVLLDVVGPCEVFAMANRISRALRSDLPAPYMIEILSIGDELKIESASGLVLSAYRSIDGFNGPADTLLLPGGIDLESLANNAGLLRWLQEMAQHTRRLGSVCTGAFLLAAAGLLNGKRATTHWQDCQLLARRYPEVRVDPDRIFVRDGNLYTSAGVTAGMDLALALVEEDLGRELALKVARNLVMFVRRPGGQSQFSTLLESQATDLQPLRELVVWVMQHPSDDLSVEALAERVNMSPRNFSRTFRREVGKTPARYVEALRVEAARRMLEDTDAKLDRIARDCGLGSGNSMLRSFLRVLGVAPSQYRERFRSR